MIVGLLRLLAGVLGWLLLVVIAVAGIGAAVFSIGSGDGSLAYANAAQLIALPDLRDLVDPWLRGLEDGGATDVASLLAGVGAVLLGLALLVGALVPRKDRLVVVEDADGGTLAVRRRAAAGAVTGALTRPRDVQQARTRVRVKRRGTGGRAVARLDHGATADAAALTAEAQDGASAVTADLGLKLRVRGRARGRVS